MSIYVPKKREYFTCFWPVTQKTIPPVQSQAASELAGVAAQWESFFLAIDDGWERPGRLLAPWEAELLMLANLCKFNPYGSKHCLRRYLTLQIIPQSHFLRRYGWIHREWWLMDLMIYYIQYFMNMYNMYGNHYIIHINNLYNNPLIIINFMNMYNMSVV